MLTLAGITEVVTNPWVVSLAGVAVLLSFALKVISLRERERTRREVAAYVAEGSMTAEEGARLLAAGADAAEAMQAPHGALESTHVHTCRI